jgi:S-adenosylmethionine-diacylgycerolhomoserine-N-methlytransferase
MPSLHTESKSSRTHETPSASQGELSSHQAEAMNHMYRFTRHVYDFSRKYYLLGRDRMLDELAAPQGAKVLEVGCGTGRNLIRLAKRCPHAKYYGLDIARVMIEKAEWRLKKQGLQDCVELHCSPAEELNDSNVFAEIGEFDVIYFSYCLSMIPTWNQAMEAAFNRLKPGGCLHIVDFWDQSGWPRWFAGALRRWLEWFGVHFRYELLEELKLWAEQGKGKLQLKSICRNYAYYAVFKKN